MDQIPVDDIDEAACRAVGIILRETIESLSTLMALRIQFKEQLLRVDRTGISTNENNPLKIAGLSTDKILGLLLGGDAPEYRPLPEAVAEALQDTRTHLAAIVKGMQSAFGDLLAHLEPDRIEKEAESKTGKDLLGGKRKVWDLYRQRYGRIADADFYDVFGKGFAQVYREVEGAARKGHRG